DRLRHLYVLRVASGRAPQLDGEAVGIAGFGQELTCALRVVVVRSDRRVAEDAWGDRGVTGASGSTHDELDDLFVVDGVVDRLAYTGVVERLHQVVEVDVDGAQAGDVVHGDVRVGVDTGDVLRRDADGDVCLTGLHHRHAGGVLRNVEEADATHAGLRAPVTVVAGEVDALAALPGRERERAGADRVLFDELVAVVVTHGRAIDGRRGVAQVSPEAREGRVQLEHDRMVVDHFDDFDGVDEERERVGVRRVDEALYAELDDLCRQGRT